MKKLIDEMNEKAAQAFAEAGYDPSYGKVTVSNRPDLCEYQCNGAMAAAKAYRKAPIQIAEAVAAALEKEDMFEEITAVKPGFINIKLDRGYLARYLMKMREDSHLSAETAEKPETIIIDYGGPNVAKPLHVGHLRSAIIGESIKRMGALPGT